MRLIKPALVFVALASVVACARRAPTPIAPAVGVRKPVASPAASASPTPEAQRAVAIALLRARLEPVTTRRRLRLPGDQAIALHPLEPGRYAFFVRCHAYVPASSLPWVYDARGTVDLTQRVVALEDLAAVAPAPLDPKDPGLFPPFSPPPPAAAGRVIHVPRPIGTPGAQP